MAEIQTVTALIIRENNHIGEADRFVTALTDRLGVVRASARSAQKIKSRRAAATRLLSLSKLSLVKGRSQYIVDEAQPLHVFFELRSDITALALAQYFCELAGVMVPPEEPAGEALALLCRALRHLERADRPLPLVKAVTELRLLTLGGFMPALTGCARCGNSAAAGYVFSPQEGRLLCQNCAVALAPDRVTSGRPEGPQSLPVTPGVLQALRHITGCPPEKCFSFSLGEENGRTLAALSETYLLTQLSRGFRTLTFYHSL